MSDGDNLALADLKRLTGQALAASSLADCHALAVALLPKEDSVIVPTDGASLPDYIIHPLFDMLCNFVNAERVAALEDIKRSSNRNATNSQKIAAVGELYEIGYDDDVVFDDLRRRIRGVSDADWNKTFRRYGQPKMKMQTRAGIWLRQQDSYSYKAVYNQENKLLNVFLVEIRDYAERNPPIISRIHSTVSPTSDEQPSAETGQPSCQAPCTITASDNTLTDAATEVANAVRRELEAQERVRKITNPFPIPVRFENASDDLVDPNIGDPARAISLSGSFLEIAEVYRRVPTKRVVILGKPGGGKTALATQLALSLLDSEVREPDTIVPIILSLSTWNAENVSLRDWMTSQITRQYPGLGARHIDSLIHVAGRPLAEALVADRCVLPILDGLDELPGKQYSRALEAIDAALGRGEGIVLTSRLEEYRRAVEGGSSLSQAFVLQVKDVTLTDMENYLPRTNCKRSSDGKTVAEKWKPVLEQMHNAANDPAAASLLGALSTPLDISLARTAYSDSGADPGELLEAAKFPTMTAIRRRLFDVFVKNAYDYPPQDERLERFHRCWTAEEARGWLESLAARMCWANSRSLSWWDLPLLLTRRCFRLPAGVMVAFFFLAWICFGFRNSGYPFLLALGPTLVAFILGLNLTWHDASSIRRRGLSRTRLGLRWRQAGTEPRIRYPLAAAIYAGSIILMLGVVVGIVQALFRVGTTYTRGLSIVVAVWLWLFTYGLCRLVNHLVVLERAARGEHASELRRTIRIVGMAEAAAAGVLAGCVSVVAMALWSLGGETPPFVIVPLNVCMATVIIGLQTHWAICECARIRLLLSGAIPRDLLSFLEEACRRGIFKRVGASYGFSHNLLHDHLAMTAVSSRLAGKLARAVRSRVSISLAYSNFDTGQDAVAVDELRNIFDKACLEHGELAEQTMVAHFSLAGALAACGNLEKALDEANAIVELASQSEVLVPAAFAAHMMAAEILMKLGRTEDGYYEYYTARRVVSSWRIYDLEGAEIKRAMLQEFVKTIRARSDNPDGS